MPNRGVDEVGAGEGLIASKAEYLRLLIFFKYVRLIFLCQEGTRVAMAQNLEIHL